MCGVRSGLIRTAAQWCSLCEKGVGDFIIICYVCLFSQFINQSENKFVVKLTVTNQHFVQMDFFQNVSSYFFGNIPPNCIFKTNHRFLTASLNVDTVFCSPISNKNIYVLKLIHRFENYKSLCYWKVLNNPSIGPLGILAQNCQY